MTTLTLATTQPAAQQRGAQADAAVRALVQQACGHPASSTAKKVPVYRPRAHTQTPDSWATISAPS